MKLLNAMYYKKRYNTCKVKLDALKVENYDLKEKMEKLKDKNKNDRYILEKIKELPKSKKVELGLYESNN